MGAATQDRHSASDGSKLLARIMLALALLLTVAGVGTARVVISGEAEIAASTEALKRGDPREAVVRSRRAAGWYAPGAPHVGVAYDRLIALAIAAEEQRDDGLALLAWRAVRTAAIETRWLVTPPAADLEQANQEIARLMSKKPKVAEPDARIASEQLQKLYRHQSPRVGWVIALVLAFFVAAAGAAVWSRQVASAGGRLHWGRAKSGALLMVVGIVLWLVAVWRA